MKKIIYIFLITLAFQFSAIAQADLEVEGIGVMKKTLFVGENSTSSNNELVINDYDNNGSSFLTLNDGIRTGLIGIDNIAKGITGTTSTNDLQFYTNGVARLHIDASGDVGLGTINPGSAFHVSSPGVFNIPEEVVVLESAASNKPVLLFTEDGLGPDNTMGILYNGAGSGADEKLQIINTSSTPIVTWANNGFMGINTETPRAVLDVNGNAAISAVPGSLILKNGTNESELSFDGNTMTLDAIGGTTKVLANRRVILDAGDDVILDAKDDILFQIDGATQMICNQSGNWGMNQTAPNARFHIKQNNASIHAIRIENNSNTTSWSWQVSSTTSNLLLYVGTTLIGLYETNGTYLNFSDRRLKEEITPLKNGTLSSLLQLNPCSYYYKKDKQSKHKTIGFIAQELQEQFPTLVSENDNPDSDILGVNYSGISVVAVKAIQEQNLEIKTFIKEVKQDKTSLADLDESEVALTNLEKRIAALNK